MKAGEWELEQGEVVVLHGDCGLFGYWYGPFPGRAYLTTKRLLWMPLKLGWLIKLQPPPKSFEFDLRDIRDVVTDRFSFWTRLRLLVGTEVHVLTMRSNWYRNDAASTAAKWKHHIEALVRSVSGLPAEET